MIATLKKKIAWALYKGLYKPGHFYSPIPDLNEISDRTKQIFKHDRPLGIALNESGQLELLEAFKAFVPEFVWPEEKSAGYKYYRNNGFFNTTDAFVLYAMMRKFGSKKIVEVGSGFSSALMVDVNEKYLAHPAELTFIEPFPDRLKSLIGENELSVNCRLLKQFVQDVDKTVFEQLKENDILFIDSSHVSKVGSDVNYLFFEILPLLATGVIIHIHDICYPFEYPEDWVRNGTYWNEAYLLRSFLMYNNAFEVLLFNNQWANAPQNDNPYIRSGGSIWIKKVSA